MVNLVVILRLDDFEVSDYVSPIVIVPKKDGSVRLCVDLTKLNKKFLDPVTNYPLSTRHSDV